MHRYRRDDFDRLLVCLVWSLNEFFQVPVDLSHWILGLGEFSSIYTSLTLSATSSHPSSHPLLCLAPREERKNKGEKRGEMRAYRRPSSSFLSKNWWLHSGSCLVHLSSSMKASECSSGCYRFDLLFHRLHSNIQNHRILS